ncbi:penicillin-binding protein 1A [Methylococcus sp. EFPC2]|uniref:penicillin-binding protein 1A n=1 Tax=Methylococcus sp. EFPC2 TaxID=2812648 RepID=UPI001967D044|nr:penicillin-binding protein 1A [Methylococcus sp. EFPC2]QSA96202.1 penicillin-binding protein 1A [Methylococcus sp. EFPC2]
MARYVLAFGVIAFAVGLLTAYGVYRHLVPQLPDVEQLKDVRYQMPMSVYTRDGLLIAQFGEKKHTPLSIDEIPRAAINAFLAAEDDRFFDHPGVDYQGLLRATFKFLQTGEKRQGGSTITMQVARNFFLSSEKTFFRKLREILLAIKIESRLPKKQILELYLNKIYFGHHAYGFAAAAQVYFGKTVNELSLGEIAMIAGLPKAPSAYNPIANPERALIRRDYVLNRMRKLNLIDEAQHQRALAEPVRAALHSAEVAFNAPQVAEMVRAEMVQQYGEDAYVNGYKIYTTVDSRLQETAQTALRRTLHDYDERHGFRGVKRHYDLKKVGGEKGWDDLLADIPPLGDTLPGIVLAVKDRNAEVYLGATRRANLTWDQIKWARTYVNENTLGPVPRSVKDVLKPGDVVRVREQAPGTWTLTQTPEVAGALVSLDPSNGAILAIAGGYDFNDSKFNRATQAQRQPGSGFKPVLYSAALEAGYTPASVINDAPFVYYDPSIEGGAWRPQNYTNKYSGPTRLRVALMKSLNLVSIRLLREIGVKKAIETATRFGFNPSDLPHSLTLALGSGTATPLKMAQAYAVFANGGFRVEPYLVQRILTQDGSTLFEATPPTACPDCEDGATRVGNVAPRVLSAQTHYMMHSMLQDVVRKGTAIKAMQLGRSDLAGKTGTTNEQRDAWFNGYTPAMVAVAWMGFDSYKPLGDGETGGHAALPMWMSYMQEALKDVPERSFGVPTGITTARIDPASGQLASSGGVYEVFPTDKVPRNYAAPRETAETEEAPSEVDEEATPSLPPPRETARQGSKLLESLF